MLDAFTTPEDQKKAIIALLLRLKYADGKSELVEIGYILRVAQQLGLDEEDVRQIKIRLHDYPLQPPADESSRMTILYYLLFFMDVDGRISRREEKLVQEFGFRLGFRTTLTTDLIGLIKEYAGKHVPPEEMLSKIKAYLN